MALGIPVSLENSESDIVQVHKGEDIKMPEISDSTLEKSEKNNLGFSSIDKDNDNNKEQKDNTRTIVNHQTPERLLDIQRRLKKERDTGEFILVVSEDDRRIFMSSNSGALNSQRKDRFYPKYLNFDTNNNNINTIESKGDQEIKQKDSSQKNFFSHKKKAKKNSKDNKKFGWIYSDDSENDESSELDRYKIMTIENKETPSSRKKKKDTAEKEKMRNEAFLRYSQTSSLYFQKLKEELQHDDEDFYCEEDSEESTQNEKMKKMKNSNFSKKPFSENLEGTKTSRYNNNQQQRQRVPLMKSQVVEEENENRISQNINLQRNQKSSLCQDNNKSLLIDSNLASTNPFNSQLQYENEDEKVKNPKIENSPNTHKNINTITGYKTDNNPYIESSPQFCQLPDSEIYENSQKKKNSQKKSEKIKAFNGGIRVSQPPFKDNHEQEISQHREILNSNFDMINKRISKISQIPQFQTPPPKVYGPRAPLQTDLKGEDVQQDGTGNLKNYLIKVDTEINSINGKIESILSFLQESTTKKMVNKSSKKKITDKIPLKKPYFTPTIKAHTRASPFTQNSKISSRKGTKNKRKQRNASARILWSKGKDSPLKIKKPKKEPATVNISLCDIMNASSGSATKKKPKMMPNRGFKSDQEKLNFFKNFETTKINQEVSSSTLKSGYTQKKQKYMDQAGSDEYLIFEKPKPKKKFSK